MKTYPDAVRRDLHARWAQHAAQRGAQLFGTWPDVTLRGIANGLPYAYSQYESIQERHDASGGHRDHVIRAEALYTDRERLGQLSVLVENTLHRIVKVFGAQDIVVGHPEFDRLFMVSDHDEAHARRLLTPRACEAFVRAHQAGPEAELINGEIRSRARYPIEDPALVDGHILQVTWIGSQLGG